MSFFFFNDTATTEIYTLSLHDALPIYEIVLTYKEFEVLNCLCENKGKVFSREELLNKVWGYDFEGTTRAVDILIQRLRKKLGKYQNYIKTLYKAGYKLEIDRKSTRLNSSHANISYAVFCLKK